MFCSIVNEESIIGLSRCTIVSCILFEVTISSNFDVLGLMSLKCHFVGVVNSYSVSFSWTPLTVKLIGDSINVLKSTSNTQGDNW